MIILFTGINGELGRNFAENFADKHSIIGVGRGDCKVSNLADYIRSNIAGNEEEIADYVGEKFGKIDAIVHSAVKYYFAETYVTNAQDFKDSLAVNVTAPFLLDQYCVNRYMGTDGRIVHLGSFSGEAIYPSSMTYSVTKAALNMLMKYESVEYNRFGIKVNMVIPTTFPKLVETIRVSNEVHRFLTTEETGKVAYVV